MNLFEVIPNNFFSILSSPNKRIYADALLVLHQAFKFELNIRVDNYISSLISLLEDQTFVPEEEDEIPEATMTLSGKARVILNRLIKTGWVDKEYLEGSFIEIITPRSYAIKMMKILSELGDNSFGEYTSLVFSTYSGLKQAKSEHRNQIYEAILAAKSNTENLEYELRSLYHGIRSHLRGIQEQSEVNTLLKNHFEEYKEMADRIYHPIKTMDSVYRYMHPIQTILMDILTDDEVMAQLQERAVIVKKHENADDARQELVGAIDYVLEVYHSIGSIVNEIDRKHHAYTKRSIEKIKYLMTADQSIKGKLADLLKAYAQADEADRETLGEMMENHIRVNQQEFIDGKSLYHKNVRNRHMDSVPLEINKDESFSGDAMRDMIIQMGNRYSAKKIRKFVDGLFRDNETSLSSEQIQLNNDTEFILLLLAVIRAKEKEMNYEVIIEREGIPTRRDGINNNGYHIPALIISRKETGFHVE